MKHQPLEASSRFRWLERWLEPRWRALLTWVVLAAAAGWFSASVSADRWMADWVNSWAFALESLSPVPFGAAFWRSAYIVPVAFIWAWFPPLILRLGPLRIAAWISVYMLLRILFQLGHFSVTTLSLYAYSAVQLAAVTLLFGLPGLVMAGRRSRVWLSIVTPLPLAIFLCKAAHQSGTGLSIIHRFEHLALPFACAHIVYGAVMLYGTKPLPPATRTDASSSLPNTYPN